ncbi:MAG: AraC family transcriptional regulator [Verrucomicrobiota bacterium]
MKPYLGTVPPSPGSSFTCESYDVPEFRHDYHYHPEIELTWIIESDGQRLVGDSIRPFKAGDLVLIGENLPHHFRNTCRSRARSICIQFKLEMFGSEFLQLREFSEISSLLEEANRGLSFKSKTAKAVQRLMAESLNASPGPSRITRLIDALHLLSIDRDREFLASVTYAEKINPTRIDRLQRVLNYLESHWDETVSLEDASRVAALHPQSLSRFFQKHLRMTYQEYLKRLRLGHAARALLDTNRTVTDIAFHSGFNNISNFNRHFRRVYQRTPLEYRRQEMTLRNIRTDNGELIQEASEPSRRTPRN